MTGKKQRLHLIGASIPFIIAIAIQIQLTLFSSVEYTGLRINLADILLPLTGLYVLVTLILRQSAWPAWRGGNKWIWGLMTVMTLALTLALYRGYQATGELQSWAFINKYVGFYVLLAYFLLGAWLSTNSQAGQDGQKLLHNFSRVFCGFAICVLAAFLVMTVVKISFPDTVSFPFHLQQWAGLMANRNAFMVLILFVVLCMELWRIGENPLFTDKIYALFWTLIPIAAVFNGSRAGWLFGGAALLLLLVKAPRNFLRKVLPFLILGGVLVFGLHQYAQSKSIVMKKQFHYLTALIGDTEVTYAGDQKRIEAAKSAWNLYTESNPVLGAGLGTFRNYYEQKIGGFLDIVDCSPLFLLTETGLLGLLAFSAFFIYVLWYLYKAAYKEKSPFHEAVFIFLIFIIGISLLHELLYTRFLWLLLGLAMAQPLMRKI
jgi:O-antigen ligase